ncbi:hypothetical protein SASPL_150960 [Salvia splendens]|uniref:Myb proto-oncogene protein, plant n=1 Tax=Salvia splendens TaxID=180675 RepID=A0A8X8Z3A7_SALSN|nr:hypothetical protein SASPL_150960 [Salvia splendens]
MSFSPDGAALGVGSTAVAGVAVGVCLPAAASDVGGSTAENFSAFRPLVACLVNLPKLFEKQTTYKEAVSTSHYSQHNTVEYEMAMDWCLLQSQSDEWWKRLYEGVWFLLLVKKHVTLQSAGDINIENIANVGGPAYADYLVFQVIWKVIRLRTLLQKVQEMVYKEVNLCMGNLLSTWNAYSEKKWSDKAFNKRAMDTRRAECFKDRADVQCLHRWQKVLNPELIRGPWSKEEDEIIVGLVNKYGPKKWSSIAQHLPGRIGKSGKLLSTARWHNHLNPNINKEAWTQEEELALIRAHQIYGNKWAELSKFLPGRSDNAIKNHWNSSVKKKLDMYMASGLLSQYQGTPLLVSLSNQSASSSSSKAPKSIEEDKDAAEVEEASGCSQDSVFPSTSQPVSSTINRTAHHDEDCRATAGSPSLPSPEDYPLAFQGVTYATTEAPCDPGANLQQDSSIDWRTFAGKDWQANTDDLDMSMLDLGQETSGTFMQNLSGSDNHDTLTFPKEIYMHLHDSVSMVNMDMGSENPLVHNYSNLEIPYASSSIPGASPAQPNHVPTQLPPDDGPVLLRTYPDQFDYSTHVNGEPESISPGTLNEFFYGNESNCSPREENFDEAKRSSKLVPANDFVLQPLNIDSSCCSYKEKDSADQQDSGALFYKPPRFPKLDIPFFSCDLIQSCSDMHQEYSPLGIRQLIFTSTPSILRKRHHDLLPPSSEKRDEKKLECFRPESVSNIANEIACLEVIFNECLEDQKGSRNSEQDNIVSECSGKQTNTMDKDLMDRVSAFWFPSPCELIEGQWYTGTAFKRSMESPPLGLINTCIPGPRVEPDIRNWLLEPGGGSYDAIELGKQTACALADAQKVLGDETTPESLL